MIHTATGWTHSSMFQPFKYSSNQRFYCPVKSKLELSLLLVWLELVLTSPPRKVKRTSRPFKGSRQIDTAEFTFTLTAITFIVWCTFAVLFCCQNNLCLSGKVTKLDKYFYWTLQLDVDTLDRIEVNILKFFVKQDRRLN